MGADFKAKGIKTETLKAHSLAVHSLPFLVKR
jgi:hypothetical protein